MNVYTDSYVDSLEREIERLRRENAKLDKAREEAVTSLNEALAYLDEVGFS